VQRVGIFGWGIVAPKSPDIDTFAANLESSESWLTPFNGFGPDNFLVGVPDFDFTHYKPWIDERFPPGRFPTLADKMDLTTQYAIGAFIQSLGQNAGIERDLRELGLATHVYIGTGLGAIKTLSDASLLLDAAQRRWNRFWSEPQRNGALREFLAAAPTARPGDAPPDPTTLPELEHEDGEQAWRAYWAARSPELRQYLEALRVIESLAVEGQVSSAKMSLMKEKERRRKRLQKEWGAPEPPWNSVTANVLWNIHNTPAAQVSMLAHITGLAFAPVGACATFGVALKLGMDAIARGEAKAVVVGASDGAPHPLTVGAFYAGRVIAADSQVSKPLTELRGTHVAGGAAVWILGDLEYFRARGYTPLGMEPVAVGVSSDAHHIITPSREGPTAAILQALEGAGLAPAEIETWDLHATATPGDFTEVATLRDVLPATVLVTARKGTFGHGMAAGGGFELTAQYMGVERGALYPTPLAKEQLNHEIAGVHELFVFDEACAARPRTAGKLSMGVGGVNACVISRVYSSP
jgi:3-oxoacyl-[acyl-carrier-protein] synthase II